MARLGWIVLLVSACDAGWEKIEDCAEERSVERRDECYAELLPELFRSDPEGAARMVEERIEDARLRDFVYLEVTRKVDPGSYRWCREIEEELLAERCRVLVSRPHLHRELAGEDAPERPAGQAAAPPPAELPGSGPGVPEAGSALPKDENTEDPPSGEGGPSGQ